MAEACRQAAAEIPLHPPLHSRTEADVCVVGGGLAGLTTAHHLARAGRRVVLVEARRIQKAYYYQHGTTLAGLMLDHGVDPHHFLDYVHDIDMGRIQPCQVTASALARLPGRKLIFTNGDAAYARRVLGKLGLGDSFEAIHDIHACAYQPKPNPASYQRMCERLDIRPGTALFVEDMARNLKPAKALGMTTVWVNNGSEQGAPAHPDYIDFEIADVGEWLHDILGDEE